MGKKKRKREHNKKNRAEKKSPDLEKLTALSQRYYTDHDSEDPDDDTCGLRRWFESPVAMSE